LFDKYISYPNILFIKEAERLGVYNAWNIGIQNASSEYITNWNVDDLRHPLNTKLKYDLLNINPEIALAYNYYVASSTGETFYNINMDSKSILKFPDDYHLHATKACLAGPDPMWRKSMHYVVGLFDYKRFSVAGDWDMWIRFAKAGYQFKLIPEVMCIYTDHPNTVSQQMNAKLEKEKQLINQLYN
jgi:GT2 family glycosyltransferase